MLELLKRVDWGKVKCSIGWHDWRYKSFIPDWISYCFPGKKCQRCGKGLYVPHPGGDGYPNYLHKLPPFDERKIKMNQTMHLNGGRAFNKSQFSIKYDGHEIGTAVKGREGDKAVFTIWINDEEYDMKTQADAARVAIKEKFIELFKAGLIT